MRIDDRGSGRIRGLARWLAYRQRQLRPAAPRDLLTIEQRRTLRDAMRLLRDRFDLDDETLDDPETPDDDESP
ncbi:MAG TPA: hypothetical protein VF215_09915 [Thermoanaerobaculia bacterium]